MAKRTEKQQTKQKAVSLIHLIPTNIQDLPMDIQSHRIWNKIKNRTSDRMTSKSIGKASDRMTSKNSNKTSDR